MPINFGSSGIGEIYHGSTPIKEVFHGSQLVWSSAPRVTPLTYGAATWLTFTDDVTDYGTAPQSWTLPSGTVTGGALSEGQASAVSPTFPWANSSAVSVSTWATRPNGTAAVVSTTGSNFILGFYLYSDSHAVFQYRHGSASRVDVDVPSGVVSGWNHIALVMEPVSGTTWRRRGYLNGVEVVNTTWDAGTQATPTVSEMYVGRNISGLVVDDHALFPSALSGADVLALYQAGRTGAGYYPPEPEPGQWPQTGTWSGNTTSTVTTFATFTIPEAGVYNLEWAVTWGGAGVIGGQASNQINGASNVIGNRVLSAPGTSTVTRTGVTLSPGDVLQFLAGDAFGGTRAATGAWTINKVG